MLYLRVSNMRLALKLFRGEPAISEFDWNFSAIHSSSPHFSTYVWFGPPRRLTAASSCPWIGHPVSGVLYATIRPFQTRFPCGSGALHLNLAAYSNSPARSTKSTRSLSLPLLVNIGFQVLFHSPPGVLFTFPSRYYALSVHTGILPWRVVPPASHKVSRVSWYSGYRPMHAGFQIQGFHLLRQCVPARFFYPIYI